METENLNEEAKLNNTVIGKPKLNIEEQINHMKNQGIGFNIIDEKTAAEYLRKNTYYFKLKVYAKLYDKYKQTDNIDKYINLEFAYLKDLATIDSYFRKHIMKISLDIEHYLKVWLLNDFNNSDEDGYEIVKDFIQTNPQHYNDEIKSKCTGKACSNLVVKYADKFAIWNFIEILNFGDFKQFYQFFYYRNNQFKKSCQYSYLINPVRFLRNAAAHNNCLLQSLRIPYIDAEAFNYNYNVNAFLGNNGIKSRKLARNMSKPLLHDFTAMLYLYHCIVPKEVQKYTFDELKDFLCDRVVRHKEYYSLNPTIVSAYNFIYDVVNMFVKILEENS